MKIPNTPFSTRLSGSAKETELRLRSIFQWKKKRPPVVLFALMALVVLLCFGLFSCVAEEPKQDEQNSVAENTVSPDEPPEDGKQGEITVAPIDGETLSPDGAYEVRLSGVVEGVSTDGLAAAEFVQICDTKTGNVLWQGDGAYKHAVVWSPDGKRVALSRATRTGCIVAIVETIGWTTWNVDLPEYTYLPDHGDWIAWTGSTEFRLTMGRGGDAGEEITYHFGPEDFPVAGTSEYSEDTKAVLDFVDAMFAEGDVDFWAFLFPGTGPIAATMDEYHQQVRAVFAQYEWTLETGKEPERVWSHDDWTMYLSNKTCRIAENTSSNWVNFAGHTAEGSTNVNYSYNGEPGGLSNSLLELFAEPSFRLARVYIPIEGQNNQTLMETYEARFRELYLNSGAISDYKLLELSPIEVETTTPFFLFSFSVKPTDLKSIGWENIAVKDDGWVDFSFEVSLGQGGYENDSAWMCGFWQLPGKRD